MPTDPIDQVAFAGAPALVNPRARPVSQSTTAFIAFVSLASPLVGQPSEPPLPMLSARM